MAKNEFLPFGTAANANVLSNEEYQALTARSTGFVAGVAKSKELNTAWRQASVIASVVAQFIADNSGKDVLDNGDLISLQDNLASAVLAGTPGRLLNIRTFSTSGTYTPTPGTKKIRVKLWGGGSGGCGALNSSSTGSISGGAGGYTETFISTPESVAVVIGVGGSSVGADNSGLGGAGGSSKFGSILLATGGTVTTTQGVGSGGNVINFKGQLGQGSYTPFGGTGGASYSSFGGLPHATSAADPGGFPGGGGGGASPGQASGMGANGYCIIEEYA